MPNWTMKFKTFLAVNKEHLLIRIIGHEENMSSEFRPCHFGNYRVLLSVVWSFFSRNSIELGGSTCERSHMPLVRYWALCLDSTLISFLVIFERVWPLLHKLSYHVLSHFILEFLQGVIEMNKKCRMKK